MNVPCLRTVLGNHPHVEPLRRGEIRSDLFDFEFLDHTPTNKAFRPMVREQAFDICEMAIVTYLMAKTYQKPLVLVPAVLLGRFPHAYALCNSERDFGPGDLEGKRVGIRSLTTTTGVWIRGILANDYGVNLETVHWITFEDSHVAEYNDTSERAPEGKKILQMLLNGELDATLGEGSDDPRLKPLIADPAVEALRWFARHSIMPVNHLLVVTAKLACERPDIVGEVYRLLKQSKARAAERAAPDPAPFGVEANRRSLELIVDYAI